jgi:hypothetical protein
MLVWPDTALLATNRHRPSPPATLRPKIRPYPGRQPVAIVQQRPSMPGFDQVGRHVPCVLPLPGAHNYIYTK